MIESILIIEQPETHIHPKLQQKVIEYFVTVYIREKINKKFKKLLIETHSICMIERLKTLLLKEEIKPNDLKIYYIDIDKETLKPQLKELCYIGNGKFNDLPPDYPLNSVIEESDTQMREFINNIRGKNGKKA